MHLPPCHTHICCEKKEGRVGWCDTLYFASDIAQANIRDGGEPSIPICLHYLELAWLLYHIQPDLHLFYWLGHTTSPDQSILEPSHHAVGQLLDQFQDISFNTLNNNWPILGQRKTSLFVFLWKGWTSSVVFFVTI